MAQIRSQPFGVTKAGDKVTEYILSNPGGLTVSVLNYGCVVRSIVVPAKCGPVDVVLGHDTMADYEDDFTSSGSTCCGAFVGRYANRIEKSRFTLDGKTYELEPNNGPNHLHGTFAKKVYKGSIVDGSLVLRAVSPDGEDGFPGNLELTVRYTLTDENALVLDYTATTDAPTIINLTNHSYFNLEGQSSGSMLEQTLCLNASTFTEGNAETCPTGRILPVAGTPMDFTRAKPIGRDIQAEYSQLQMCGGYDHNFILDKEPGMLALAAVARSEKTGITMETYTTQPGVQLYTSNSLQNDTRPGKTGGIYGRYQGFCLETQHYPCTPSHPEFPSVELRPGEEYHETTIYKFLTE